VLCLVQPPFEVALCGSLFEDWLKLSLVLAPTNLIGCGMARFGLGPLKKINDLYEYVNLYTHIREIAVLTGDFPETNPILSNKINTPGL
jgi:hypothetical protein